MFSRIIYIFLLHKTKCFYAELEGFPHQTNQKRDSNLKLEPKVFYWFEVKNEIHLVYFDNSLNFHERPFLLFVVVPGANRTTWFNSRNCQLFSTTFDNFYRNSAFFSLLPNEPSKNLYKFSTEIWGSTIDAEIELGETTTLSIASSEVKNFAFCTSLLEKIKVGTIASSRFYEVEDDLYGLFVETYYIVYQDIDESLRTVNFFRTADLVEIGYVLFQTSLKEESLFLTGNEYSIKTNCIQKIAACSKNKYSFLFFFPFFSESGVVFDLKENKEKQYWFFSNDKKVYKEIDTPSIERLLQIGTNRYSLKNKFDGKVSAELPVYCFGEELELSGLMFMLKLTRAKTFGELYEERIFFAQFDFNETINSSWVYFNNISYHLTFSYTIEDSNIVFGIDRVKIKNSNECVLIEGETIGKIEPVKRNSALAFLGGAIIYNHDVTVLLTNSNHSSTTVTKFEFDTKEQTYSEKTSCRQKDKVIKTSVILILLGVCLFVGRLFYCFNKSTKKEKKLTNLTKERFL